MVPAFAQIEIFFRHYGLPAVFVILLLENLGLPLPGELTLFYAGYHSRVHGSFGLLLLVLVASLASFLGQLGGYSIGRFARPWALRLLHFGGRGARQARLESYFQKHGPWTILFARFVTVLRLLAGPAAGIYRMPWRSFLLCNALGAMLWTAVLTQLGAQLGAHWQRLLHLAGRLDLVLLVAAILAIVLAWRKLRPGDSHAR